MRIYRRSAGGPYWCDFWHGGRRVRESTGTRDEAAAREYADRRKAELWRFARLGDRPAVTWDAAALDWLESHQHLKALADRKDQLRFATKHLGGRALATIDRDTLEKLARAKARTGVADATVNRHLAAVSAVLGHAVARGWLTALPSIPRRQERANRFRWATHAQAAKLIAALPDHLAPMAAFSLATGLRRANVMALEWTNVDLRRRTCWIHADQAKSGHALQVPLNDDAVRVLRAQRGRHRQFVFPYRGRAMARQGSPAWRAACAKAGLRGFRWHDLRHTWASWHVQAGTQLAELQQLGGWRALSMVLRYGHLAPSHVAAAAGNISLTGNRTGHSPPARAVAGSR